MLLDIPAFRAVDNTWKCVFAWINSSLSFATYHISSSIYFFLDSHKYFFRYNRKIAFKISLKHPKSHLFQHFYILLFYFIDINTTLSSVLKYRKPFILPRLNEPWYYTKNNMGNYKTSDYLPSFLILL